MPKILEKGIFHLTELKFPEQIMEGIRAECYKCFALLETEKGDKGRVGKKMSKRDRIYFPGWFIKCPECGAMVFFPFADASSDLIGRANGWRKDERKEEI